MLQICSIWNVAGVFFKEPTKGQGLLEVCRKTNLAHTSVKKHIKRLKQAGIIYEHKEKKGSRLYPLYKAKQDTKRFRDYKKLYNFSELIDSGLIDYIKDTLTPKSIVLFGSYQRGEDTEDSDIDLFVEASNREISLSRFEKRLKRKIQLHFKKNFGEYPPDLKNNIINGTLLEGYLEAFK